MEDGTIVIKNGIMWFTLPSKKISFWDVISFRPDIKGQLKDNTSYKVRIHFSKENLTNGDLIFVPRKIVVNSMSFVNVR